MTDEIDTDTDTDTEELVENFALFDDWEERYKYLIDLGREMPALAESEKTEANRVYGCTSRVWLVIEPVRDDSNRLVMTFRGESDAHIVNGLIAVLRIIYSGRPVDAAASLDVAEIFSKLGLESHLSPNRRSGFFAMVDRIKNTAAALASGGSAGGGDKAASSEG